MILVLVVSKINWELLSACYDQIGLREVSFLNKPDLEKLRIRLKYVTRISLWFIVIN